MTRQWFLRLGCAAVVLVYAMSVHAETPLAVKNLRCEYKVDPLGIDVRKPRLSWELASAEKGVMETSYEVKVAGSEAELAMGKVIWDSGNQVSDASIQVEYGGPALESGRIYYWQGRVADNHGHLSDWSKTTRWEMGLLEAVDWKAKWITPNLPEDEMKSNPVPLLRRAFSVKKKVQRARLYATAMGLYEMSLNGNRVGDEYFTPGWTAYDFRYQYQTYDVTSSVKSGENCLGVGLGDGWFRGRVAWDNKRNSYGKKLALLAQLVITYTDGTQEIVGSDDKWKAATGAVLESDIYNGETYDARLERAGWRSPDGKDSGASRACREKDRRDKAGEGVSDASRRYGHRHGAKHGGLGKVPPNGTGRNDCYLAVRGGARQGGKFLYGQSARRERNDSLHEQGAGDRNVRAAFHVSGVPICSGERMAGRSKGGELFGSRGAFSDCEDRDV